MSKCAPVAWKLIRYCCSLTCKIVTLFLCKISDLPFPICLDLATKWYIPHGQTNNVTSQDFTAGWVKTSVSMFIFHSYLRLRHLDDNVCIENKVDNMTAISSDSQRFVKWLFTLSTFNFTLVTFNEVCSYIQRARL